MIETEMPPYKRTLPSEDAKRVEALEKEIDELQAAGKFQEALAPARKALAIRLRVQGERHWQTADARRRFRTLEQIVVLPAGAQRELTDAFKLSAEFAQNPHHGSSPEVRSQLKRALDIQRRRLGEEHPDVASTMTHLGVLLDVSGKHGEAQPLYEKALAVRRRALGDDHPETAEGYHCVAENLKVQGQSVKAQRYYEKALAIVRQVHGDNHRLTAISFNNVASNLQEQGRYAEAQPFYEKALAIFRRVQGEDDPFTAISYGELARNLRAQGRYAEAQPLYERVLAITRQVWGDDRPVTAIRYHEVALNLYYQGRHAEAQPLVDKALAIFRRVQGDNHPDTAPSYTTMAFALQAQGRHTEAEVLFSKALAIVRQARGDNHPDTATGYHNVALNLRHQGRYAEAQPLFEKALGLRRRMRGNNHPDTATSYDNLASNLQAQGRYAEAEALWGKAADSFEVARLRSHNPGLGRASFATARSAPHFPLAACLARTNHPAEAWRRLEHGLARGLLEEVGARLAQPLPPKDQQRQQDLTQKLEQLDRAIAKILFGKEKTDAGQARLEQLLRDRQAEEEDLARWSAALSAREVYDVARVQAAFAPEIALAAWVDIRGEAHAADPNGEHWACVLRHRGLPVWVKLPGSGAQGAWTKDDDDLPGQVREALAQPGDFDAKKDLLEKLRAQRLNLLQPHLQATADLLAVRHLVVLPAGWMAGVPLEALTDAYTISYSPSGTMFAKLREQRPTFAGARLLAVGDPAFALPEAPPQEAPPPDHGVLLASVVRDSNAAQNGLRSGDVLLRYGPTKLQSAKDLTAALGAQSNTSPEAKAKAPIAVQVWRDGQTLDLTVRPGPLGVKPDSQPVAEAIRSRRDGDWALRASRGPTFAPLPGTRAEVLAIAGLFDKPLTLLGTDATEQRFAALAKNSELKQYRYLHLATHGDMNDRIGLQSALILSPERRSDADPKATAELPVQNSRLTAAEIREHWQLDAELVTLSACQTGLGRQAGGEGYLGFTQALFTVGARSLVVSLWKVDDKATALLMRRFYQNLLGKRDGLTRPMPKAEALREAKQWLRTLSRKEAEQFAAQLPKVERSGQRPLKVRGDQPADRPPYADPYFWAAFILIGDPN
jgi:tetratricopeptide (TPR) repeat protein